MTGIQEPSVHRFAPWFPGAPIRVPAHPCELERVWGSSVMRPLPLVAALLALALPVRAHGQDLRGIGLFGGTSQSRQVREREPNSDTRTGLVAGGYLDVAVGGVWSVLAEGSYVERGGSYSGDDAGEVEADYLSMTVAPEWHLDVAFLGAFAYGGPSLELNVRSRSSPNLAGAYQDPSSQVLSVTAGGGVEIRVLSTYAFRLEVRHVEGLSTAYTGDAGDFRHRSTEILVRVGRHGT